MTQHTLLFEDMIRAETETHICRIWRQFDGWAPSRIENMALKELATEFMARKDLSVTDIVTALVSVDRVNSVEIIDRESGDGVCVHKDWP